MTQTAINLVSCIIMSFKSGVKQKMYLIEIATELSSEATKLILLALQNQSVWKRPFFFYTN